MPERTLTSSTFADRLDLALRQSGRPLAELSAQLAALGLHCSPATLSQWRRGRTHPRRAAARRALVELETLLDVPAGFLRPEEPAPAPGNPHDRRAARREQSVLTYGEEFSATRAAFGLDADHEVEIIAFLETVRLDERRRFTGARCTMYLRGAREGAERLLFSAYSFDDGGGPRAWPRLAEPVRGARLGRRRLFPRSGQAISELVLDAPLGLGELTMVDIAVTPVGGPEESSALDVHERRTARRVDQLVLCLDFDPRALPVAVHRLQPGVPSGGAPHIEVPTDHPVQLLGSRAVITASAPAEPGVGMRWDWERPEG